MVLGTVVPIGDGIDSNATAVVIKVTKNVGGSGTLIAKLRNTEATWEKTVTAKDLGVPVAVTDTDVVGSLPPKNSILLVGSKLAEDSCEAK